MDLEFFQPLSVSEACRILIEKEGARPFAESSLKI